MLFIHTTSVEKHVLVKRLFNRWIFFLWFYKTHKSKFVSGLNQWSYTRQIGPMAYEISYLCVQEGRGG